MSDKKYFPEGLALGETFLNRIEERTYLINRIKANKHSVLMAPRRYGKTSLVVKVAEEMKVSYCMLDFLAAYSAEYVRDQIISEVGKLVIAILPRMQKAKEKLLSIFKQMKPEISLGAFGQRLSLTLSNNKPLQDITEVLLKLDETAGYFKKKAVIFMDEFQQISKLNNHHSIEAAIRHAVERSKNITYVFSGSNRQLLQQMFGDQGRPLYRLCQTINIDRMPATVYLEYLQHCAKMKWKSLLSEEAIERIFINTELHPFYLNVLCQMLWERKYPFLANEVDDIWHSYVVTQRHIISHDLVELSVNQRKMMMALAKKSAKEIQSVQFTTAIKISASSAQQALSVLMQKDLIYKNFLEEFAVLDPAVRYYLDVILG